MKTNDPVNLDALWEKVLAIAPPHTRSLHGPDHWARVERNGVFLAGPSGADETVVRLFALLHDAQRENEGADPDHGRRAAALAERIRADLPPLAPGAFEQLRAACIGHADGGLADDVTVGVCWDADRLDLRRIGVAPDPEFLHTPLAIDIARRGLFPQLDGLPVREM